MSNITGERLRALRDEFGFTQDTVGNAVGVDAKVIARCERGFTIPRGEHLVALARLFEVSTDYLLGLSDERHHTLTSKEREVVTLVRQARDPRLMVEFLRRMTTPI